MAGGHLHRGDQLSGPGEEGGTKHIYAPKLLYDFYPLESTGVLIIMNWIKFEVPGLFYARDRFLVKQCGCLSFTSRSHLVVIGDNDTGSV